MTSSVELDVGELRKLPVSASCWYMHDSHTFTRLGGTIDEVLQQVREQCAKSSYGMLSNVRVLDGNEKELRSVGGSVHARKAFDEAELAKWRAAVEADTEAVALLSAWRDASKGGGA